MLAVPALLAASRAVTVMTFEPGCSGTLADHDAIPDTFPLPPALFDHDTEVTPTLSVALPDKLADAELTEIVEPFVPGETNVTTGEMKSVFRAKFATKLTFVAGIEKLHVDANPQAA